MLCDHQPICGSSAAQSGPWAIRHVAMWICFRRFGHPFCSEDKTPFFMSTNLGELQWGAEQTFGLNSTPTYHLPLTILYELAQSAPPNSKTDNTLEGTATDCAPVSMRGLLRPDTGS